MLRLEGNLCEVGDVVPYSPGFRIERPDGRVITVTGLTREEVQGLDLFADVTLSVTDAGVPPSHEAQQDEPTTDQLLELAGALEQRRGLAIVEAVTALATGYHEGAFRAGFETACEEITTRLRTEVWDGCLPPVDAATPHGVPPSDGGQQG